MQNEADAARRIVHLIHTTYGLLDSVRRTAAGHEELAAIVDDRLMEMISILGDMRHNVGKRLDILRMIGEAERVANHNSS